jgi:lipopolysaccharide biosynthesis glycosyltransferase
MSAPPVPRRFYTSALRNYMPGLMALCRSFRTHHPHDELRVVRMPGNDFTPADVARLAGAGAKLVTLEADDLTHFIQRTLPNSRTRYGLETYAKLALVEVINEPFYWLDADAVVNSPIDPEGVLGADAFGFASPSPRLRGSCVRDSGDPRVRARIQPYVDPVRWQAETPSFNCGLMWLDPARLRATDFPALARRVLKTLADQLTRADESVFNLLSHRFDIRFFPPHSQRYVEATQVVSPGGDEAPWVVHFVGAEKPWMIGRLHSGWNDFDRWLTEDDRAEIESRC